MTSLAGVPDVAGQLGHGYLFGKKRKWGRLGISIMDGEFAEINT
jgi:hypothetical protein